MDRVRLPFSGVAAVLLTASVAAGQTPQPGTDYYSSIPLLRFFAPEVVWEPPMEEPSFELDEPPLASMADGQLVSFETVVPPKDDPARIKPTAQPSQSSQPCAEPVEESGPMEFEDFPSFSCMPFAPPPPPPPCDCRKCRRQRKHSGCGQGYGYPYAGGPYGMNGGCCGYYPPPQQCSSGHKCRRKHQAQPSCPYPGYGYPGYGYPGFAGGPGPWGGWDTMARAAMVSAPAAILRPIVLRRIYATRATSAAASTVTTAKFVRAAAIPATAPVGTTRWAVGPPATTGTMDSAIPTATRMAAAASSATACSIAAVRASKARLPILTRTTRPCRRRAWTAARSDSIRPDAPGLARE